MKNFLGLLLMVILCGIYSSGCKKEPDSVVLKINAQMMIDYNIAEKLLELQAQKIMATGITRSHQIMASSNTATQNTCKDFLFIKDDVNNSFLKCTGIRMNFHAIQGKLLQNELCVPKGTTEIEIYKKLENPVTRESIRRGIDAVRMKHTTQNILEINKHLPALQEEVSIVFCDALKNIYKNQDKNL